MIGLGAKMAKADGLVRPAEVAAFRQVFQIAPEDEAAAARVFNLARQDVAGFEVYAGRIAAMFRGEPRVLEDILEGLFHIAMADGRYHAGEEGFLRRVAEIFGIAPLAFDCIEARHLDGRSQDPWQVLGVARDADLRTVRARWRELVRANHPDKMIARGLPVETVNLANARLAAINARLGGDLGPQARAGGGRLGRATRNPRRAGQDTSIRLWKAQWSAHISSSPRRARQPSSSAARPGRRRIRRRRRARRPTIS